MQVYDGVYVRQDVRLQSSALTMSHSTRYPMPESVREYGPGSVPMTEVLNQPSHQVVQSTHPMPRLHRQGVVYPNLIGRSDNARVLREMAVETLYAAQM